MDESHRQKFTLVKYAQLAVWVAIIVASGLWGQKVWTQYQMTAMTNGNFTKTMPVATDRIDDVNVAPPRRSRANTVAQQAQPAEQAAPTVPRPDAATQEEAALVTDTPNRDPSIAQAPPSRTPGQSSVPAETEQDISTLADSQETTASVAAETEPHVASAVAVETPTPELDSPSPTPDVEAARDRTKQLFSALGQARRNINWRGVASRLQDNAQNQSVVASDSTPDQTLEVTQPVDTPAISFPIQEPVALEATAEPEVTAEVATQETSVANSDSPEVTDREVTPRELPVGQDETEGQSIANLDETPEPDTTEVTRTNDADTQDLTQTETEHDNAARDNLTQEVATPAVPEPTLQTASGPSLPPGVVRVANTTDYPVSFLWKTQVYPVGPKQTVDLPLNTESQTRIKFDRGGSFGETEVTCKPGIVEFHVGRQGWRLEPQTNQQD